MPGRGQGEKRSGTALKSKAKQIPYPLEEEEEERRRKKKEFSDEVKCYVDGPPLCVNRNGSTSMLNKF